jgi:hypothetical protein
LGNFGTSFELVQAKEPGCFVSAHGVMESLARPIVWKRDMNLDSIFSAIVFSALLLSMGVVAISTLFLLSGGGKIFGQVKILYKDNSSE